MFWVASASRVQCQSGSDFRRLAETLDHEQRRIFQQVAELFEIDRAERAVDNPMVAAHPDRHAMTDNDLITMIDDRHFIDFADGENEALWWINDGGKTDDPDATEI